MSIERKRWALLAQEAQFSQLEFARKSADTWRAGLATLTALLAGVLVVKGRTDASTVKLPFQVTVAVLLGLALVTLLAATLWLSRALAGPPRGDVVLSGESLEQWTRKEVRAIEDALAWAPWLGAAGIILVAAAVALTWFAPSKPAATTTGSVLVTMSAGGQACGSLVGVSQHQLVIKSAAGPAVIPLSAVVKVTPVAACG